MKKRKNKADCLNLIAKMNADEKRVAEYWERQQNGINSRENLLRTTAINKEIALAKVAEQD